MCGRFTLSTPTEPLGEWFDVPNPPALHPRYNIAPSQLIAVVALRSNGVRGMARFRWGLLCSWAESPHERPQPINARAESVAYTFGENLREKRCLVPADGFFEWRTEGKRKRANYFSMLDGKPFAFAGLWDVWEGEETKIASACIVTTTPNELVRTVHDRMPVILPRENYAEWLAPETPVTRLLELLNPYPADVMRAREVGIAVNSPKNDGPECLEVA